MPPQDEMLQFMDESGLINIYMIVLSFLVSPVDEIDLFVFDSQMEAMRLQGQVYQSQIKAIISHQIKLTSVEMVDLRNTKTDSQSNTAVAALNEHIQKK